VHSFFLWLEDTALSLWIRETPSVFAFPAILTAHAIGMGFAVGVNAAMALRLLGVAPGVPPRELKRFVPFMWFGFWVNTISGVLLLLAYPTKAMTNPLFYLKIFLIAAGMWLYTKMGRLMFSAAETPVGTSGFTGHQLAIASLTCWAAAITAGRLLAYTATHILASHY